MKLLRWIALIALAAVPYAGALHAPLLYDDRTLLDNTWLTREAGPVSVFRHDYWHGTRHAGSDLYRPLTVLSLAWNVRAVPTKEGIRAGNLAAHALSVLVLCWMLGAILPRRAAWIGAALFAVHPLGSEAVLWAVGRAEILAAAFGMAAFALLARLDDERGAGGWRLALSASAWLLALCFKESAAAWVLIGALWAALRRTPLKLAAVRSAVYGGALVVYLALRGQAVGWTRHDVPFVDNPLAALDPATRAANAVLLFARYVAKMVWPRTLSVEYGFDQIPAVPLLPWAAPAALAVAALLIAGVVALRRRGQLPAAFLLAFVPAAFALTSNLAFPIGTIFAERLAYLPLAAFCALLGLAASAIPKPVPRAITVAVVVLALGARTLVRDADYRDAATLSEATAAASPRAVKALANAGRARLRQGKPADAVPLLERAVAIWPDYARAWELLADACAASGDAARADDARRRAREAAEQRPPADDPL